MTSRRNFLKGLFATGVATMVMPMEVWGKEPKQNVLKRLIESPVQLGISARGRGYVYAPHYPLYMTPIING